MTNISTRQGFVPCQVEEPSAGSAWPGVVVVHDALGMTEDLRQQTRWLAEAGYLAAAPDLFHGDSRGRCLFAVMRDLSRGSGGRSFEELTAVRHWLARHRRCTGKVAALGFCLGGGFALALAPGGDFDACGASYGAMTQRTWARMPRACPIVASYGGRDPSLRGEAARLERVLSEHGVPHDIKEYPGVGHGFMNDHPPGDGNRIFRLFAWLSNTRYDQDATRDARRRILAFFNQHLRESAAVST